MGWLDLVTGAVAPSMPRVPRAFVGDYAYYDDGTSKRLDSAPPRVPDRFVGDYAYYDDGTKEYIGQGEDPARYNGLYDEWGRYNGGGLGGYAQPQLPSFDYLDMLPDLDNYVPPIEDEPYFL